MQTVETPELLTRASYDNGIVITAGNAFVRSTGFWIMPLSNSGNVVATTFGDQAISHALPVSVFPLKMKNLAASTAVDVLVMW